MVTDLAEPLLFLKACVIRASHFFIQGVFLVTGSSLQRELKPPKTIEEQLVILRSRGLIIKNEEHAIDILKRVNYYRFTAYLLTFKNKDVVYPGTTFEKIYRHYEFDSKLRNLIMEIIEYVEIAFRSHIGYEIGHKYGPLGYEEAGNFRDQGNHSKFIKDLRRSILKSKDPFVLHHSVEYNNQFPSWVAFEVCTFSAISMIFKNLLIEDQKHITRKYYEKIDYQEIANWLHILSIVRNRCAHYSRMFNHIFTLGVRFRPRDKALEIRENRLFAAIFNLKYLVLNEPTWKNWVTRLEALISGYQEVDIRLLGFPEDWYALLNN